MRHLAIIMGALLFAPTALAEPATTLYTSTDCSGPSYMPPPWGRPPIQMLRIGSRSDGGKCTTLPPFPMLVGVPPAQLSTDPSGNSPAATRSQPSLDCARAGSASERAICARSDLSQLDREISAAYNAVSATQGGDYQSLLVSQREWLGKRNACGSDMQCLQQTMSARAAELHELLRRTKPIEPLGLSSSSPAADSFQQGVADRAAMEKWVTGLTGDYKRGVDWWAEHRSAAKPGPCRGREAASLEFISGCEAAKARLAPADAKRKSDPEYRRGWNTYNDAPTTQPFAAAGPVPPANQAGGSDHKDPSGADSAATGEHTSMRRLAAEENIQPAGQYEGSYKVPGIEAKVALLAGHSHAAIIVEYREQAGTPSITDLYCQYLLESKTAHTGDLVTNFGNNRPPSSPTCPRLITVNLQPDDQHPNITLEFGPTTIRTSVSSPNLETGSIPNATPDNIETGGLKLSNTFRELRDNLQANDFVIEELDSMTPSGIKAYKNLLAYKSIALAELKQYCSQTSASGIAAKEIISLQFPYSANMDGLYPIAIKRVVSFPPGEEILIPELEEQVAKKYGPPTRREGPNWSTWNYDKNGNVFTAGNIRNQSNAVRMQFYSKTKSGTILESIEAPPDHCERPSQTLSIPACNVDLNCPRKDSDSVKVNSSCNLGYTVYLSNDPRCAFTIDTRFTKGQQDKVEQFSAAIFSRENAVNALHDIQASELDLSVSKMLADIKRSKGKDFKP